MAAISGGSRNDLDATGKVRHHSVAGWLGCLVLLAASVAGCRTADWSGPDGQLPDGGGSPGVVAQICEAMGRARTGTELAKIKVSIDRMPYAEAGSHAGSGSRASGVEIRQELLGALFKRWGQIDHMEAFAFITHDWEAKGKPLDRRRHELMGATPADAGKTPWASYGYWDFLDEVAVGFAEVDWPSAREWSLEICRARLAQPVTKLDILFALPNGSYVADADYEAKTSLPAVVLRVQSKIPPRERFMHWLRFHMERRPDDPVPSFLPVTILSEFAETRDTAWVLDRLRDRRCDDIRESCISMLATSCADAQSPDWAKALELVSLLSEYAQHHRTAYIYEKWLEAGGFSDALKSCEDMKFGSAMRDAAYLKLATAGPEIIRDMDLALALGEKCAREESRRNSKAEIALEWAGRFPDRCIAIADELRESAASTGLARLHLGVARRWGKADPESAIRWCLEHFSFDKIMQEDALYYIYRDWADRDPIPARRHLADMPRLPVFRGAFVAVFHSIWRSGNGDFGETTRWLCGVDQPGAKEALRALVSLARRHAPGHLEQTLRQIETLTPELLREVSEESEGLRDPGFPRYETQEDRDFQRMLEVI